MTRGRTGAHICKTAPPECLLIPCAVTSGVTPPSSLTLFLPRLGGDKGSMPVSWPTLHPVKLFEQMAPVFPAFPFTVFRDFMKRAGINSGYQEKPCLDPRDPQCPDSAPNKASGLAPDVGAELTGGCYGFATRYMHWPEQLVVGGGVKNKTGYVRQAGGLQSMVQLMGARDMHDYWADTYKVTSINWSQEKAEEILRKFQQNFEAAINMNTKTGKKFDFHSYSSLGLQNIMNTFSEVNMPNIAVGYVFMLMYSMASLYRWSDKVRSQAGLGLAGVILVAFTVAAGMGLAALIGISFNAASTQIVPFLALGLGVDSMFLMVHTFAQQTSLDIPYKVSNAWVVPKRERERGTTNIRAALSNGKPATAAQQFKRPDLDQDVLLGLQLSSAGGP